MKNINKNNCEAFFLDYYEGQLDEQQRQMLHKFLGENPEWKRVFDEYGEVPEADAVLIANGDETMSAADYPTLLDEDDDLIALLEGQLNETDAQNLQHKIAQNAALAAAFRRYELTRLKPELSVVFPHKQELKKGVPVVSLFARYSAIAALMAGAFIAVWVFSTRENSANVAEYSPRPVQNNSAAQSVLITKEKQTFSSQIEEVDASKVNKESPVQESGAASLIANQNENSAPGEPVRDESTSPEVVAKANPRSERIEMTTMDIKSSSRELLASLEIDQPQLVKSDKPDQLPKTTTVESTTASGASERSLFGSFLSEIGQSFADRVKAATDEEVVIEKEEHQEEELVTSTFKLGAFEVYRSKSK